MLLIHKPRNHKLLILVITSVCCIGALLSLSALTYTPELSRAEQVTYPSLSNITYMQDMTADICKHSHENETKQLIDSRDGKTYWVTKLKDENCWMTQNLALDLDTTKSLTSTDSDISSNWTPPANTQQGIITKFPSSSDMALSYDPGEYVYTTPMERNSCGTSSITKIEGCPNWKLTSGLSKDIGGNEQAHYLAGNYYSYEVATVGSAPASGGASNSICPKGWRLPSTDDYTNLTNGLTVSITDTANNIKLAPYYFVYGGYVHHSSLVSAGSLGYYWSSMANNDTRAYNLNFNTNVNPSGTLVRYVGTSVRCVARTDPPETRTLSDLTYMQDMTMDVCKNSAVGESKQLIDKRTNFNGTNPSYWVEKLRDDNCWMTQNLDLDIPAEGLKAEDTDIPKDWNSGSNYPPKATQTTTAPSFNSANDVIMSWDPALGRTATYCNDGATASKCKTSGNPTTSVNNGHDAQGNYYSWVAATAGQAATLTSGTRGEQSTQSICPKGWRLPLSGKSSENVLWNDSRSFAYLFESYGWAWDLGYMTSNLNGGTQYSVLDSPFYFVYGGHVFGDSLDNAGSSGYYWSSTVYSSDGAYDLYFDTRVFPSDYWGWWYGNSIRCVSPGGEKQNYDNIEITVNPQLTLDVASETTVNKTDANPSTGDLKVKVSSNQPYVVELSSDDATMKSSTTSATIPAKSGLLNTAENGWGIMKHGASEYTAITNTPELFYQSASPEVQELLLKVGISTAPDLPSGEYSTDITVTATQN